MDNPNESILLTEDGHPIGEVVIADNSSAPPAPTEASVAESREALLKSTAAELTGDPDGDKAVVELYPSYADAEKRKLAMLFYVTQGRAIKDVAGELGVPERTVSMWAYTFGWDRLLKQELAARQTQSVMELAKVRAEKRTQIVEEQLKQAQTLRNTAIDKLKEGETSVKSATEAWAAAAKIEHTLVGVSEAGEVANLDGEDPEKKKDGGKQPLVAVIMGGGLPPIRKPQ
jgi:transposase-like protein